MHIENTTEADLPFVYSLFEQAIVFQQKNGYNVWKGYDKDVLRREMREGLQYKLVIDGKIALVFSAIYSDKFLWHETDNDDAVYVHRLVVNPEYRGQRLFGEVFNWLLAEAKRRERKYLRLDTWGDNPKMISYYESFGYRFVRNYRSGNDPNLPLPHRNMFFALMEYKVNDTGF
jgi:GNAT superfamily N-acetyltransferase